MTPLIITYRNYRGEVAVRVVTPEGVRFGSTEWHPEPQWLMDAFDHGKRAMRTFAVKDILTTGFVELLDASRRVLRCLDGEYGQPPGETPNPLIVAADRDIAKAALRAAIAMIDGTAPL